MEDVTVMAKRVTTTDCAKLADAIAAQIEALAQRASTQARDLTIELVLFMLGRRLSAKASWFIQGAWAAEELAKGDAAGRA